MDTKQFVAKGSNGSVHFIASDYPRKWLLDYYGVSSATKIYRGESQHVGWIVSGQWFTVYELKSL